jgi:hypothetical protein
MSGALWVCCDCSCAEEEHPGRAPCRNRAKCGCEGFVGRAIAHASQGGHPRFHELINEMRAMHVAKGSDYSRPEDILSNLRVCEQMGVPAWVGVLVRLSDKFERVKNLARKSQAGEEAAVKDESVIDTLKDASAYCLLAVILLEERDRR